MSDSAYVKAFREYTRNDPTIDDLPAMEKEFYGDSDRSMVILQAAMVEVVLESAIQKMMRKNLSKEIEKELFDFDGPIGTFSAKIIVAYALSIFGPQTKHDLDLIRLMRNQFAHCRKPLRFIVPEVAKICEHLQLPDVAGISLTPMALVKIAPDRIVKVDLKNPRTRYVTSCNSIASHLIEWMQENSTAPFPSSMLP